MNEQFERFVELLRTPPRSARAAYDAVAHRYDEYEQAWLHVVGAEAIRRVEAILAERLFPAARLLDAGIGTGATAARALATGQAPRILGIDLSREMLNVARERFVGSPVELVQADLTHLPLRTGRFDVVVSTWVLETLPDPRAAVTEMLRVLSPEGFLVCAFSSSATDLVGRLEQSLLERPLSEFAGRFLSDTERPMHWCPRSSLERFHHGLTTVIVLGTCCTVDEFGPCLPVVERSAR